MFRFRFRRLAEVKEKLLEHKRQELEMTVAAVAALRQGIADVEKETAERYEGMVGRSLTGEEFSLLMGHLAFLDSRKKAMREEKKKTDVRVGILRKELAGLAAELKMFEKLRLKDFQAARLLDRKKEQKVMDELASRRGGALEMGKGGVENSSR